MIDLLSHLLFEAGAIGGGSGLCPRIFGEPPTYLRISGTTAQRTSGARDRVNCLPRRDARSDSLKTQLQSQYSDPL